VENRSTEDYLKAIYQLGLDGRPVSTTALADRLVVRSASITGMLQTLARKHLVHYERYRGVSLTVKGRKSALTIVRRHRLWEIFLVRFLGYSWDRVHEEAERLEHVTSAELDRRLDRVLDFPVTDPHGDPIPSAGGRVRRGSSRRLSECPAGSHVVVRRVSDRHADILKHVAAAGLRLDRAVEILEKRAHDGSMTVRLGRRSLVLSGKLAASVYVEEQRKRG
jgi:DtxR family Mn-dependent transcriptional regulator